MLEKLAKSLFGKKTTYRNQPYVRMKTKCPKGTCSYKYAYKAMGTIVYWCENCTTEKRVHDNIIVKILDTNT